MRPTRPPTRRSTIPASRSPKAHAKARRPRRRSRRPTPLRRPTASETANNALRETDRLVRLQRQAPFRPFHCEADCRLERLLTLFAVHRLDEEMVEGPAFQLGRVDACLWPDELQFVAVALHDIRAGLGADAD